MGLGPVVVFFGPYFSCFYVRPNLRNEVRLVSLAGEEIPCLTEEDVCGLAEILVR